MAIKLEAKGVHVPDLLQIMRDGTKELEDPTEVPPGLAEVVGRFLELFGTATGDPPVGKQWEVECNGDLKKGITLHVKLGDAPKPPAEPKPAPASEGPTATPAPAPAHKGK